MVHSPFPFAGIAVQARRLFRRRAVRSAMLAASLLAALTAQAQTATKPARPDPLDPDAKVPALRYESALVPARRQGDDKPVTWREANDTVTRIGGWRVYTREAHQPDPAPAAKPVDATPAAKPNETAKPMPAGHHGHKTP